MLNKSAVPAIDASELQSHRAALVRFAMLQVRNEAVVEDLVQETFLAALSPSNRFLGASSMRTWLTGILRHKIVDHFRTAGRHVSVDTMARDADADVIDAMFHSNGSYLESPLDWGDPEELLTQRRFLETLERCVAGLPIVTAQAFLMRELMGFETPEICKELDISSTNCFVLLHRARMRLRACMEQSWGNMADRK